MNTQNIHKQNHKLEHEHGNVLFYILIAVVLFSALSYAVANMLQGGNSEKINTERAGITADELLSYAQKLKQSTDMLRISNECGESDISLETPALTGYAHTPVATDTCKVFHTDGAGMTYLSPSEDSASAGTNWTFVGSLNIPGLGTDCVSGDSCTELLAVLEHVPLTVCNKINEKMGISTVTTLPPVQDAPLVFTKFTGSYTWVSALSDSAHDNVLKGKSAGCSATSTGSDYFFYQTLITR